MYLPANMRELRRRERDAEFRADREAGMGCDEARAKYGIGRDTFYTWLIELGIPATRPGQAMDHRRVKRLARNEEFRAAYLAGTPLNDLLMQFGIADNTYRLWIKELGLPSRSHGKPRTSKATNTHPLDDRVRELHPTMSYAELAKTLHLSNRTIAAIVARLGLVRAAALQNPTRFKPKPKTVDFVRRGTIGYKATVTSRLLKVSRPTLPAGSPESWGLISGEPWPGVGPRA